jgi:hypothetical protein
LASAEPIGQLVERLFFCVIGRFAGQLPDRTAAAALARRQHAAGLVRDVHDALRKLRRDRTRITFRGVAARAGVSRTFLYENPEARCLVEDAIAATSQERRVAVVEQDNQAEASWRERALNAEDALSYISSFENPRMEALLKAGRAETNAQFFEGWANGTLTNMSDADKKVLQWAADNSRGNKYGYETRAQQFAQYVEKVPERARQFIAAYPGKGKYHMLSPDASLGLQTGQKILKGMPYVGSTLTIVNEAAGAASGEQSWGKAVADSGGLILGGSLGAAAASAGVTALWGAPLGPVGAFVTGTLGGIAGAIGGQAVADWLVPK